MTNPGGCPEADELVKPQNQIDDCMARDIPALHKQLRSLLTRCRRAQPVERGLARLQSAVAESNQRSAARMADLPEPAYPLSLPVVERREDILELIASHQTIIVCGETGSGKTTQLPKLCLELGRGTRGMIGHTQPRRLAARSLAGRIAEELGSHLGAEVGYKVRFQDRVQASSYVKVMTDGILLAEIQSDPDLLAYDTLILDEAHERSLNIDFLLGYLHRLLPRRPDLKLIITSATIDPQRFADHFQQAPIIEVSGRTYPVDIRYRPLQGEDDDRKERDRGQALLDAVDELAAEGRGDIMVFLPGERAIREASELLRKHHPSHTEIVPLYARLSAAQQNQVFKPHTGRRIVLATNVAETSLTVPGIHYVIDTGLARISRYNYRTKVQRLPVEAISQASANQRAGRCGRVAAGICIRLYAEEDYLSRPEFTETEIQRTNLAAVILQMVTLGLGSIEVFPFIDPPDMRFIRDGYKLLHELGAVDEQQQLTRMGRQLARLPVDPRLARMILAASETRCLKEVLIIVAALEVMDPRERPLEKAQAADEKHALFRDERSDFHTYIRLWNAYAEQAKHLSQNKLRGWCRTHFLSFMRMREWIDVHRQLQAQVHAMGFSSNREDADYQAVHSALLTGLLGNIAFQSEPGEYIGARNLKFVLFPGSGLSKKRPKWLMAAELVETGRRYLRTAAAIEPGWVEPLAGDLVKRSYSEPHWEHKRAQVVAYERVTLYGLPLVQRRKVDFSRIDPLVSRQLFIRHALVRGEYHTRLAFAAHNRALLDKLDLLESKSRRRDLLVDEEVLYEFFEQRLPASVQDASSFQRWWKKAEKQQPELLNLAAEAVVQRPTNDITPDQYPDSLEVRGVQLPVRYRFSPGDSDDGLKVRVPLAALSQVSNADFEWLVPGLLKEKCTLLIKSLPKPLRRHFVPAPDFAEVCIQAMDEHSGSLIDALGSELTRIGNVDIPAEAWRPDRLPAHLAVFFEVVDASQKVLGHGADLEQLRHALRDQLQDSTVSLSDVRYERRDVVRWDFGELPEYVEIDRGGVRLRAYPALTVVEGRIDLCLFDHAEKAEHAHAEGLLALYRLCAGSLVKDIRRSVLQWDKQALWFSTLGSAGELQVDLERAALRAAFMPAERAIRDAGSFTRQLEEGRECLLQHAVAIGDQSYRALDEYRQLSGQLGKALSPQFLAAATDIREQVAELVYPGFISATPSDWLPHLSRYLLAARHRLENLAGNTGRDRQYTAQLASYWQRYQQALAKGRSADSLSWYRWMIEELRVSLFAQALGTVEKISPQRLDKLWKELQH
jgi:ATP-dependent helicase HrpA